MFLHPKSNFQPDKKEALKLESLISKFSNELSKLGADNFVMVIQMKNYATISGTADKQFMDKAVIKILQHKEGI